jgi:hypothetical protein
MPLSKRGAFSALSGIELDPKGKDIATASHQEPGEGSGT